MEVLLDLLIHCTKKNIFVSYFLLKFKHSETYISTSQNVSTSRNAHPLPVFPL